MPHKLPLTVEPAARETLPSFFSRMAAINGTDAAGFALDIGTTFKKILNQEKAAIAIFAARAGLSPERLARMLSWTGTRVGNVRMRFRGEVFVSRALRNPVLRGCPHCLREAAENQPFPQRHMAMSGDWLCRGVDLCLRHRHPLVPLWQSARPVERDDCAARLAGILPNILAGRLDRDPVVPSAYDHWLDQRLSQGEDTTWLATQPLFAAMSFCALLGAELLREQGRGADSRAAKAMGFDVASRGPEAIEAALDRLTRAGDGGHFITKSALGALYEALDHLYRDDDSFDGLRDIVRTHVLGIWPLAAGDEVLGHILSERRLHSLVSASKDTGIGQAVLKDFLTEAGAFAPDDARADAHKIFDAKTYQPLLDEIPTLLGPIAMRAAMGATRAELKSLEAGGILTPRTKIPTIKSPWRVADGLALVEELERRAVPVATDAPGWETIQLAHKRLGVGVGQIIAAIRAGGLVVGKRAGVFGYHGIVVQAAQTDHLQPAQTEKSEGRISAAAFARALGLRQKDAFLTLVEADHTPATQVLNPVTKRPQWRMTDADIAAFHARFTTPSAMAQETGHHRNTILAALKDDNVPAFQPDGLDVGPIYLRDDVNPVLSKLRA